MKQFLIIICLFFAFQSTSQTLKFRFDGLIVNYDSGKKEGGVKVEIVQNGATIESTTTASNGKYVIMKDIDYSIPFDVVFSKAGLVSKRINFNMAGLNVEDTPAGAEYKPVENLSVELFAKRPNVDFSFLETEPVGSFKWSTSKGAADLNVTAEAKIRTKIERLLAEAEAGGSKDADYNKALSEADNFFNEKKYNEALEKYELALGIKPKEKYPKDRILAIDALLQKMKEEELNSQQGDFEYNNLIKAADNFRNSKQYAKAIEKYEEALTKKDELYPKDEIKKIEKILKEADSEGAYKEAIEVADMLFKQKSYKDAKKKYETARDLKPNEAYPKTKLAEIEAKLKEEEATAGIRKKYDEAVAAGDGFYDEEKWAEAKTKYEEALAIESGSAYVSGRLKLVNDELAKLKLKEENAKLIEKLLSEGSVALIGKKYEEALTKYKEVLKLDENNDVANTKIPEIEALIAEEKDVEARNKKFAEFVAKGDEAVAGKKLEIAVENYTQALEIKEDVVVQTKLDDVNKRIEDAKNAEQKEADYKLLVEEAKSLFDAKEYTTSLAKYESAKVIKPTDPIVIKKIDEINAILKLESEEKLKQEKIQTLLAAAESQFAEEKWEDAKLGFMEVIKLEPTNPTAVERIKDVLAKIAEAKQQEKLDADFAAFEKKGDDDDVAKKYESAVTNYKEALKIKLEPRVQEKLVAVEAKINEQASAAEKEANYAKEIKQADKYFTEKSYELAKERYQAALAIKENEAYPTEKIATIDKFLADINAEKEKKANILTLLDDGAKLLSDKEYVAAQTKYEEVLALESSNSIAKDKIAEIKSVLASQEQNAAKDTQFEKLKAEGLDLLGQNELYPAREKIKEALAVKVDYDLRKTLEDLEATIRSTEERKEKIASLLAQGQKQIEAKNYENAVMRYEEVLSIDADNAEAKAKLDVINEMQSAIMDGQALQAQFSDLKKLGMDLAAAKEYEPAKENLLAALQMQPEDKDIPKVLADIEKIYADKKLAEERLSSLLTEGQTLLDAKKYEDAKKKYNEVLKLDPSNPIAPTKIEQIDAELSNLMSEAEKNANFEKLKKEGFALAESKKWEEAKEKLELALAIKEETAVKMKLDEIAKTIESEATQAEIDLKYNRAVEKAQEYEVEKSYSDAISKYKEALDLKKNEAMPKAKIEELTKIFEAESKAKEIDEKYNEFLASGDELVGKEEYLAAIDAYNQALKLKPTEKIPVDKAKQAQELANKNKVEVDAVYEKMLTAISEKIKEEDFKRANELIDRALSLRPEDNRPKALRTQIENIEKRNADYKSLIVKGDEQALSNNFEQAISLYEQAKKIHPENPEAEQKIAALRELMKENLGEQNEAKFQKFIEDGKSSEDDLRYSKALENYSGALGIKPADQFTQEKVSSLKSRLADLARMGLTEEQMRTQFNNLVKEGDMKYGTNKYQESVDAYRGALKLIPDNESVKQKLADAEKSLASSAEIEVENNYRKIVTEADKFLTAKDYSKAKELYNRALTIKPSDIYPREKLAEIDLILNPVSQTTAKLEDLGEIYDNSTMDGMLALQKAEEERVNLKSTKVKRKLSRISDQEEQMMKNKSQEQQDAVNDVYAVYRSINQNTEAATLDHAGTIEAVKQVELKIENQATENNAFEQNSVVKTQDLLYEVVKSNGIDYSDRQKVYGENSEELGKIRVEEAKITSEKSTDYYTGNIQTNLTLDSIVKVNRTETIDNQNERIEEANKAEEIRKKTELMNDERNLLSYDKTISNEVFVAEILKENASTDQQQSLSASENNLNLKEIQTNAEDAESIKLGSSKFKTISNDQRLNQFDIAYSEEEALKAAKQEKNTEMVKEVDKKANTLASGKALSDDEERLNMQDKVETIQLKGSDTDSKEAEKLQANTSKLTEIGTNANKGAAEDATTKQESLQNTKASIDKMESKKVEKSVTINSLGKEYPPGVSQETFQQKDENGIMKSIITRRIVVQDGRGDVYVKTQTVNATTYTKNGTPISEHVWQKETQAAHLQRYY